jgi:hypothetical protein
VRWAFNHRRGRVASFNKRGEQKENKKRVTMPPTPTWIASPIRELRGGLEVGFLYIVIENNNYQIDVVQKSKRIGKQDVF